MRRLPAWRRKEAANAKWPRAGLCLIAKLLQRIGITDFDIRVPRTEETYPAGLTPRETVEYISREKSDAAAALCTPEEIIITADTMVFLDDQRLGKPVDEAGHWNCGNRWNE